MKKQTNIPTSASQKNVYNTSSIGRNETVQEDDRPFAEMRKNINDVLRMISLHRWVFFIPFCLVSCSAFVASLYYPRTYQAKTSFERRNDPVMMNLPMSAGAASFKYFRNTMVRDLTSADTVEEALGVMDIPENLEREEDGTLTRSSRRKRRHKANALAKTLRASTSSPSELIDIINITYTGPDPTIGKKLVDQLKKTYVKRTMIWIHDFLVSQRDYFYDQSLDAMVALKKAQQNHTRMRLNHPMMHPTDPGTLSMRLSQLELEKRDLELRHREYTSELSTQRQMLAALDPVGAATMESQKVTPTVEPDFNRLISPEVIRLRDQLNKLAMQIDQLRTTRGMTDSHPEIQRHLLTMRSIENRLSALGVQGTPVITRPQSATVVSASSPFSGEQSTREWQAERSRLHVQIASQESKIKDLDISMKINDRALNQMLTAKDSIYQNQEKFAEINSEVAKARQEYGRLQTTLAQIEPAIKAIEQNRLLQFSEGQPARGSRTPISPKATTIILLALLAGIAAGVVFVILAELFDHVYRSSTQVARSLGMPILEAVDEIITSHDRRKLLVQRAVVTPLVLIICFGLTGITGAMAYLSINQPWTYQKLRNIPQAALDLFVDQVIEDNDSHS